MKKPTFENIILEVYDKTKENGLGIGYTELRGHFLDQDRKELERQLREMYKVGGIGIRELRESNPDCDCKRCSPVIEYFYYADV